MQADAKAAAEQIIAYHKAQGHSCATQAKAAFTCAPGMGFLMLLVALSELFTNTLLLMLDVVNDRSLVYLSM